MKMNVEYITPDRAVSLLSGQLANRPLKDGHVERLVRAVSSGNFKLSPFPVVLDRAGQLVDGQHRLTACVRSGVVLPFWVCRLEDGESPADIRMQGNSSVPPTNSDLLAFENPGDKHYKLRSSIAKFVLHMETGMPVNVSVGYHEVRSVLEKHGERIEWAVGITTGAALRKLVPAHFGGMSVWAMTSRPGASNISPVVEGFANRYVAGTGLTAGDPELALRNAMLASDRPIDRLSFIPKYAALLLAAINGERRDRAQGSIGALETIAKMIGKIPPAWAMNRPGRS